MVLQLQLALAVFFLARLSTANLFVAIKFSHFSVFHIFSVACSYRIEATTFFSPYHLSKICMAMGMVMGHGMVSLVAACLGTVSRLDIKSSWYICYTLLALTRAPAIQVDPTTLYTITARVHWLFVMGTAWAWAQARA